MIDKADRYDYWMKDFRAIEIAAITETNLRTVYMWKKVGVPDRQHTLMQLYSGELKADDWEDAVSDRIEEMEQKVRRWKRESTKKQANIGTRYLPGKK